MAKSRRHVSEYLFDIQVVHFACRPGDDITEAVERAVERALGEGALVSVSSRTYRLDSWDGWASSPAPDLERERATRAHHAEHG